MLKRVQCGRCYLNSFTQLTYEKMVRAKRPGMSVIHMYLHIKLLVHGMLNGYRTASMLYKYKA